MERVDYESMVVQEIVNAYDRGELNVSPWYQRRAVWTNPQKAYLINSVFELMPVPSLYIRHALDLEQGRTVKEIVDGQQRVRSILEYKSDGFAARHPEHAARVRFSDLSRSQREKFLMSKLPVAYLIGADDSDVIEIFGRLNAVSKTLNAQEKRSAKWSGEFHQFCLREAVTRLPIWRGLGIFSANDISRMLEVQFTAEVVMALLKGMTDYSSARIDSAYREWDEEFPDRRDVERTLERVYGVISSLDPNYIAGTVFARGPVFYSLVLVLALEQKIVSVAKVGEALREIDTRFNDPRPASERPAEDLEFVAACSSSTQRIKSRQIRYSYISGFLSA
ncbi:DUF262 domain-containing protein [Brachybacterium paraconglomeratum]|uniref:DUF262 domain-containing protein n=1 Tax=Brachybacterium paraconglomeratum TaxID=173362 RepID=UPI0035132941